MTSKEGHKIFKPKDTYRIFGGSADRPIPGLGQNPKRGVTFDYYLNKEADTLDLKLEVIDQGEVIRTITNKKQKDFKSWPGGPSKPAVLPAKKGYNRFSWNFNRDALPAVDKVFVYGNYSGASVAPGTYVLRLTLEDEVSETEVTILQNPKIKASAADFNQQQTALRQIENTIGDIHESVNNMRSAKSQLKDYEKLLKDNDAAKTLIDKGKELIKRIDTWERNLIQPDQKTFQDVINFNNKLNAQLMHLKGFIDVPEPKLTEGAKERLQDLLNEWRGFKTERDDIINSEMTAYNSLFRQLNLPAIIIKD